MKESPRRVRQAFSFATRTVLDFTWRPPVKAKREFTVVIERDEEGYYVARVPELRGCHTQAKNLDTLMKRVREAIELCLDVEGQPTEPLELVGIQRVTL